MKTKYDNERNERKDKIPKIKIRKKIVKKIVGK